MVDLNPSSWRLIKIGTKNSPISTKASYTPVWAAVTTSSVVECAARDRKEVGSIPDRGEKKKDNNNKQTKREKKKFSLLEILVNKESESELTGEFFSLARVNFPC